MGVSEAPGLRGRRIEGLSRMKQRRKVKKRLTTSLFRRQPFPLAAN